MARSGTTTMLNALYNTNEFASLTYEDMPFILAPNFWNKINKSHKNNIIYKERSHGDGIQISIKSPEAFEEVFWRVFSKDNYIFEKSLKKYELSQEIICLFKDFQKLVCIKNKKKRYLSKNNNQILRLNSLTRNIDNSVFLILFRNPLSQAKSLNNQHQRFLNSNNFTKHYMKWLVHHEFGIIHKPFDLSNCKIKFENEINMEYWVDRWIDFYEYVLNLNQTIKQSNLILINYDKLCGDNNYWKSINAYLKLPQTNSPFVSQNNKNENIFQLGNIKKAKEIYNELKNLSDFFY